MKLLIKSNKVVIRVGICIYNTYLFSVWFFSLVDLLVELVKLSVPGITTDTSSACDLPDRPDCGCNS